MPLTSHNNDISQEVNEWFIDPIIKIQEHKQTSTQSHNDDRLIELLRSSFSQVIWHINVTDSPKKQVKIHA